NLQVMLSVLLRGQTLEAAVAAPRFHQQDFPDKIQYEEGGFDSSWVAALEKLGHTVALRTDDLALRPATIGRVHAIARDASDRITAVADPRGGGVGLVVRPAPCPGCSRVGSLGEGSPPPALSGGACAAPSRSAAASEPGSLAHAREARRDRSCHSRSG